VLAVGLRASSPPSGKRAPAAVELLVLLAALPLLRVNTLEALRFVASWPPNTSTGAVSTAAAIVVNGPSWLLLYAGTLVKCCMYAGFTLRSTKTVYSRNKRGVSDRNSSLVADCLPVETDQTHLWWATTYLLLLDVLWLVDHLKGYQSVD
jgi:hypothetical protein